MRPIALPALTLALALLTQCQKNDPDPVSALPPETQTGANTFGCLVNGQAWTPRGYNGFSNYQVDFDPTYRGGELGLHTYRYNDAKTTFQSIIFGGDSISHVAIYQLNILPHSATFEDTGRPTGCKSYDSRYGSYCRGMLHVTRMDKSAGIISGTFNFTLAQPGCDTIKVTQGRFDKKL